MFFFNAGRDIAYGLCDRERDLCDFTARIEDEFLIYLQVSTASRKRKKKPPTKITRQPPPPPGTFLFPETPDKECTNTTSKATPPILTPETPAKKKTIRNIAARLRGEYIPETPKKYINIVPETPEKQPEEAEAHQFEIEDDTIVSVPDTQDAMMSVPFTQDIPSSLEESARVSRNFLNFLRAVGLQ